MGTISGISPNALFGRSIGLFVTQPGGTTALALSNQDDPTKQLRIKFEITASDTETPNVARIRVYNLSNQTTAEVISEYSRVILNAGYGNNPGTIFQGTVKQYRKGKEGNLDSFLDIFAADGDLAYNAAVRNSSHPPGATAEQRITHFVASFQQQDPTITVDKNANLFLGGVLPLPRGKVMFGMAKSQMRDLADTANCRWSFQQGVLTLIPNEGYLPGIPIEINSATGMIGAPEATEQGITVRTLLNPNIKVGGAIKLNNGDITATVGAGGKPPLTFDSWASQQAFFANLNTGNDGLYRVLVIEYKGDTRDVEWYSDLVCLSINQSPQPGTTSVLPFG